MDTMVIVKNIKSKNLKWLKENTETIECSDEIVSSLIDTWDPIITNHVLYKLNKFIIDTNMDTLVENTYEIDYIETYVIRFLTMFFDSSKLAKDAWKILDEDRILSQKIGKNSILLIDKIIELIDILHENNKHQDVLTNHLQMIKVIVEYISFKINNDEKIKDKEKINNIIQEILKNIPDKVEEGWTSKKIFKNFESVILMLM